MKVARVCEIWSGALARTRRARHGSFQNPGNVLCRRATLRRSVSYELGQRVRDPEGRRASLVDCATLLHRRLVGNGREDQTTRCEQRGEAGFRSANSLSGCRKLTDNAELF